MKIKHIALVSITFFYLVACTETQNTKIDNKSTTIETTDSIENRMSNDADEPEATKIDSIVSMDSIMTKTSIDPTWQPLIKLKEQTITKLQQGNVDECQTLRDFISGYNQKISSIEFSDIKQDSSSQIYYKIQSSEGEQYLTMNPDFIKEGVQDYFSPIYQKYIDAHGSDLEKPCCSDASIIINTDELFSRTEAWSVLTEQLTDDVCQTEAKLIYKSYLSLIMEGVDNTPSFGFQTGLYSQEYIQGMDEIIVKDSTTLIAKDFTDFKQQLILAEYKQTDTLSSWIQKCLKK